MYGLRINKPAAHPASNRASGENLVLQVVQRLYG